MGQLGKALKLKAYCPNKHTVILGLKKELPLEIAMKHKNFEIVKEITPYVAIKGDDYYLRDYS